jgi:hypothetical protein
MGLRVKQYEGADQLPGRTRYSFEYGPLLYAALGSASVELPAGFDAERAAGEWEDVPGSPLHFRLRGSPGITFVPYWQIADQTFTCFPSASA